MTTNAAIDAARRVGVPVLATVRDYWPVCYWSDLIVHPDAPHLCPGCSVAAMTQCVRPRSGSMLPLAWPVIPYMRSNLKRKRRGLAQADAVIVKVKDRRPVTLGGAAASKIRTLGE